MNLLKKVWDKWRVFGHWMADVVGRVVMTAFYFTLAAPFGIGVRLFSDPLHLKPEAPRWDPREPISDRLDTV